MKANRISLAALLFLAVGSCQLSAAQKGQLAIGLVQKSCDDGDPVGCRAAGIVYSGGQGIPKDLVKARASFEKACARDDAKGCVLLAGMLLRGEGGATDTKRAETYAIKYCDADDRDACDLLTEIYDSDQYGTKDPDKARYARGASCDRSAGASVACLELARMYESGEGGIKNPERARELYEISCRKLPEARTTGVERCAAVDRSQPAPPYVVRQKEKIAVTYGGITVANCRFEEAPGVGETKRHTMTCDELPGSILMEGNIEPGAAAYDLASAEAFGQKQIGKVLTAVLSKLIPAGHQALTGAFSSLAGTSGLRLGLNNEDSFYIKAQLDFRKVASSGVLGKPIAAMYKTLKSQTGFKPVSELRLEPAFSNNNASLTLVITPFELCAATPTVKTKGLVLPIVKLKSYSLTLALSVGAGGVSVDVGTEGEGYIKPTHLDPWLRYKPSGAVSFATDSVGLSTGGQISGACQATCAEQCGCDLTQCNDEWNPLGVEAFGLKEGNFEFGVDLTAVAPIPSFAMAFSDLRLGRVQGTVAAAFDYDAKAAGFSVKVPRLSLRSVLELLGVPRARLRKVPELLTITGAELSYATSGLSIGSLTVPAGITLKGAFSVGSDLIKGSIDFNYIPPIPLDFSLEGLKSGSTIYSYFGIPQGHFKLDVDFTRFNKLILGRRELRAFRSVIEKGFRVDRVNIEFGFTRGRLFAKGRARGSVLGEAVDLTLPSIDLDLRADTIAKSIAKALARQLRGPLNKAFKEGKKIAAAAAREAEKAAKEAEKAAGEVGKAAEDVGDAIGDVLP